MSRFNIAKRQFEDNFKTFGDVNSAPEKWNLYAGLVNLAEGLEELENRIQNIESHLRNIR
jgi:hypothetical protein